jgi:hypothetical protein
VFSENLQDDFLKKMQQQRRAGPIVFKIIVLGQAGVNAVNPGILNLSGFVPHPSLQKTPNLFS